VSSGCTGGQASQRREQANSGTQTGSVFSHPHFPAFLWYLCGKASGVESGGFPLHCAQEPGGRRHGAPHQANIGFLNEMFRVDAIPCFDKLSMNGENSTHAGSNPFTLSLSKGGLDLLCLYIQIGCLSPVQKVMMDRSQTSFPRKRESRRYKHGRLLEDPGCPLP
jgi:hypothetical protein